MPKDRDESPEAARARRLERLIEKGPQPPRTPHEYVQEKMREERRKKERERPDKR